VLFISFHIYNYCRNLLLFYYQNSSVTIFEYLCNVKNPITSVYAYSVSVILRHKRFRLYESCVQNFKIKFNPPESHLE